MKKSGSLSNLFSMILLMMLTVSSFMVVLYQINVYQTMRKENEMVNKAHLPYAYLNQKLKTAEKINVEDDTLVLSSGNIKTYIYLNDNSLMELTTLEGKSLNRTLGEKLFDMDEFKVSDDNSHLIVSYVVEGKEKSIIYSFRGLQHE